MEKFDVNEVTSPASLSFFFRLGMWWRIIYGIFRLILGTALLKLIGQPFSEPIYGLMSHEITGKTGGAVLGKIYELFSTHDFTITYFLASYFLFWGIIEIFLSECLLRHIKQAFPITMILIGLFVAYSVFRFAHTHSFVLLCVIVIDLVILHLVNIEYKKFKRV